MASRYGSSTSCGTRGGPDAVVACVLATRMDDGNPRNRRQTAYAHASDVTTSSTTCRVGLVPLGTNGVKVVQWYTGRSMTSRTFSVVVE